MFKKAKELEQKETEVFKIQEKIKKHKKKICQKLVKVQKTLNNDNLLLEKFNIEGC